MDSRLLSKRIVVAAASVAACLLVTHCGTGETQNAAASSLSDSGNQGVVGTTGTTTAAGTTTSTTTGGGTVTTSTTAGDTTSTTTTTSTGGTGTTTTTTTSTGGTGTTTAATTTTSTGGTSTGGTSTGTSTGGTTTGTTTGITLTPVPEGSATFTGNVDNAPFNPKSATYYTLDNNDVVVTLWADPNACALANAGYQADGQLVELTYASWDGNNVVAVQPGSYTVEPSTFKETQGTPSNAVSYTSKDLDTSCKDKGTDGVGTGGSSSLIPPSTAGGTMVGSFTVNVGAAAVGGSFSAVNCPALQPTPGKCEGSP